jgi:hypothetical protein
MQIYHCVICKRDASGGGSKCFGGMFFKMCSDCYEDEEAVELLNAYLMQIENDETANFAVEQSD